MSSTKTVSVLDNNVTLTAGAAAHTSTVWDLADGFGGTLFIKATNGATGPTLGAQSQVWVSPDTTNWYRLGGALLAALGNSIVSSWAVNIPIGVKHAEVISGSNTGQDVVIRVEGSEVVALA